MQNADGTATCDRCGFTSLGYGVLYGMVVTDLGEATGEIDNLFVCYSCRPAVLQGLTSFGNTDGTRCSHCGYTVPVRAVSYGLLAADLAPGVTPATQRSLIFCRVNGSATVFRDRLET